MKPAPNRERLTPDRIRKFVCPPEKGQAYLWDTVAPRLAVRATPAGAKAFVFEAKLDRRTIRCTIGDVRDWVIESGDPKRPGAREEARRLATLIDQNIDPRQEKADRLAVNERRRKADEAAKRSATLESAPALAAWQAFVAARGTEKRKGKIRWGALSRRDYDRVAQEGGRPITRGRRNGRTTTQIGALRPLLAFPLREITAERVRAWLRDEVALRPTHAALAYRLLCAFLRWAAAHKEYSGQIDTAVCTAKDVRNELQKVTPKADCLQREQLKPWFNAVGKLPNPTHRVYLQTLLLTGARREELAALEWANVDFKWGSLTIHDKVQGSRVVPLTPYVASLLRELQRRNVRPLKPTAGEEWKPSPWVFASARAKNGRIQEPRIAHNRALDAAGLPPTTLHGLRRSFGTLSEWVEAPVGVVAQIMGHKPSATAEKHYRVRPLDLLRAWHTKIEGWILTEAGVQFDYGQATPRPEIHAVQATA